MGVVEEPEGAVGYNDVWTIPGEEEAALTFLGATSERRPRLTRGCGGELDAEAERAGRGGHGAKP